jgi:hypothetical protein
MQRSTYADLLESIQLVRIKPLSKKGMRELVSIALLLCFLSSCVKTENRLDWSELTPSLNQNNLVASEPSDRQQEVAEIEEADAKLYGPIAGKTTYLESHAPTPDSEGLKPRYWLRVEDYRTAEMASKRASGYSGVGTYERIASVYRKYDSFVLSKTSVRLWAVSRGRRVYALTTNVNLFGLIETPNNLKNAVAQLPEK